MYSAEHDQKRAQQEEGHDAGQIPTGAWSAEMASLTEHHGTADPRHGSLGVSWRLEGFGAALALALALVAVWHVTGSDRSWMLFYSGNSVLPALVRGSMLVGEPQHWALSAVLFIPEMGLYLTIAALGFGVKAAFVISAIVNFLLLYATLRLVGFLTHSRGEHSRQVLGTVVAFASIVALSLLDSSANANSLELPSLLATTTYYSMTVFALVVGTGLTAAVMEGRGHRLWLQIIALFIVSALSVLSNPLYLAWVVGPLSVVALLLAVVRVASWKALLCSVAPLALGSGAGLLLRLPFSSLISQGPPYADLSRELSAFVYYLRLLMARLSSPAGVISITAVLFLTILNLFVLVRSIRRKEVVPSVVAGMGFVAPVSVIIGTVIVGAVGSRYLQPMYFAPIIVLVLLPGVGRLPSGFSRWKGKPLVVATSVVVILGSVAAVQSLYVSTIAVDPSIRCVDNWISASHQSGAGRFWSIRGPKAYLRDPRQLVQVDGKFNGYTWLTDRADYEQHAVSFILSDSAAISPTVPKNAAQLPFTVIRCGRYTIFNYHRNVLTVGPLRSIEATNSKPVAALENNALMH